jgi:hypothetical protein
VRRHDVCDEQRGLVIGERNRFRLGETGVQVFQLQRFPALERHRERHFHVAAPLRPGATFLVDRHPFGQPPRHALVRHL